MSRIELCNAEIVRIANGQIRDQIIDLEIVGSIKIIECSNLFVEFDFIIERNIIGFKKQASRGQVINIISPSFVEFVERDQYAGIFRAKHAGLFVRFQCQRIPAHGGVSFSQHNKIHWFVWEVDG